MPNSLNSWSNSNRNVLYLWALIFADGYSLDWLSKPLPPRSEWNNLACGLDQPLHLILVLRQFISELLHLLQQIFSLVKLEVWLWEVSVEALLLLLHPLLGLVALVEELEGRWNVSEEMKKNVNNETLFILFNSHNLEVFQCPTYFFSATTFTGINDLIQKGKKLIILFKILKSSSIFKVNLPNFNKIAPKIIEPKTWAIT